MWERDNRRVQVFALPSFAPVATFGDAELHQPTDSGAAGGWRLRVIVSDNYMSARDEDVPPPLAELGERFKRYRLVRDGDALDAGFVASFGDTR